MPMRHGRPVRTRNTEHGGGAGHHPPGPSTFGQVEQRAELAVDPAGSVRRVAIEHGDAFLHLVERRLQQIAILLQRFGSVIQQAVGFA